MSTTVSMSKAVLFPTIQFREQKQVHFKQFSLTQVRSLNIKTDLFQAIQFSITTQIISVWPIDRTLSGTTTPDLSGPRSDGNEELLRIPQSSSFTKPSPSKC